MTADTPTFVAPGPGHWSLDRSHYPGGTTPISQWLIGESMAAGMERVMAEIGAPVRRVEARFVNGFMYTRVWPLIGGDKPAKRLPPLPILKLVARLHPEFRRRAKQATITLRDRPALDVARRWDAEIRPRLRVLNQSFQDADPAALDDPALQQQIGRAARPSSPAVRAALLAARPRPRTDRPLPLRSDRVGPRTEGGDRSTRRRLTIDGQAGRDAVRVAHARRRLGSRCRVAR